MRIIATAVKAKDLKPGDLFCAAGQEYFDNVVSGDFVGQKVYIRTNALCPKDQAEDETHRITIER